MIQDTSADDFPVSGLVVVSQNPFIVALVATNGRDRLLTTRSLPSIAQQERVPDALIVVDDSTLLSGHTESAVRSFESDSGIPATYLRNSRTRGASGAWNTGVLAAMRWDAERIHLAILDDDDEWEPSHLSQADSCIRQTGADYVASALIRRKSGSADQAVSPPEKLNPSDFLVGNPGVVGSTFVLRLSALLEAGRFDES